MPELPEVETIRGGLHTLIVGKVIQFAHHIDSPKSFPNNQSDVNVFMLGATVTAVRRRAKVLLIDLSSGYTLVIHLKMTGQLVYVGSSPLPSSQLSQAKTARRSLGGGPVIRSAPSFEKSKISSKAGAAPPAATPLSQSVDRFGGGHPTDSLVGELPDRFTRVVIAFTDGSHLFFNDLRKFGWVKLYPTAEVPNINFMQRVGPEPLEDSFTPTEFIPRVRRRSNTSIKAAILDQTVLAGVGNIYADESLWGAKIHPATRVKNVSDAQLALLLEQIKYVMNLSLKHGGSTDKNYVDAEGKKGNYLKFANVFRRQGQTCPRHPDVLIEKLRVAGRGTHVCPVCQVEAA